MDDLALNELQKSVKINEIKSHANKILQGTDYMILRQLENADLYLETKLSGSEYVKLLEKREAIREQCRNEILRLNELTDYYEICTFKYEIG